MSDTSEVFVAFSSGAYDRINAFEPFEETAKIIERRGNKTNAQQGLCEGFVDKETGKNALRWRG